MVEDAEVQGLREALPTGERVLRQEVPALGTACGDAAPEVMIAGVDPGKKGAIALLDSGGGLHRLIPMPVLNLDRPEYDLIAIRRIFVPAVQLAVVEKAQPLPRSMPGGGIANFHRGVSRGGWEWFCVALLIPYMLVSPARWQRSMLDGLPPGDSGERSILAAKRLFPDANLKRSPRSRKDDDGMAEALLIAEYGRRLHV